MPGEVHMNRRLEIADILTFSTVSDMCIFKIGDNNNGRFDCSRLSRYILPTCIKVWKYLASSLDNYYAVSHGHHREISIEKLLP